MRIYFVMGTLMFIFNGLTLYEIFACGNTSIYHEGEFVECISAFCYLFASLLTFFRGFDRRGLERKLTLIFSLTCLLFFVRELDLEHLNIPSLLSTLGSSTGRNVFFVAIYSVLFISVCSSSVDRSGLRLKVFLSSPVMRISVLGGVFLVVGWIFERLHSDMIEEIFEMNGSFLILFAAILHERLPISSSSRGRQPLVF